MIVEEEAKKKKKQREMRGANSNTLDTISAAATAIASAENRVPQASLVSQFLAWLSEGFL